MPVIMELSGKRPQVAAGAFIAPTAALIGDVVVEEGASIWFGAVLRGDFGRIFVGKNTSIQDNVVVHTMVDGETIISDDVTVAHGSILHNCTVRHGAIIGLNAVLLDFCEIGEKAMVAAGSVVTANMKIPAKHLAAGTPAKIKKEITGASLSWVDSSAAHYREMANSYLEQGIGRADSLFSEG